MRRFLKIAIVFMAVVVGLLTVWIMAVRYLPPQVLYRAQIHRAEDAIREIEKYRAQHGSYPRESEYELPKADMFYTRKDDSYEIGFSVGFDESYTYDSRTKKWSFEK